MLGLHPPPLLPESLQTPRAVGWLTLRGVVWLRLRTCLLGDMVLACLVYLSVCVPLPLPLSQRGAEVPLLERRLLVACGKCRRQYFMSVGRTVFFLFFSSENEGCGGVEVGVLFFCVNSCVRGAT